MTERGKYFVVEGNDGTGKSTQVELLGEYLREEKGIKTFITHEPGGTPIADAIRETIKNGDLERDADTNILLFTAARHEIWRRARAELELGTYVLSARNYLSTIAYQIWGERIDDDFDMLERQAHDVHDLTRRYTDELYMAPDGIVILELDDSTRQERISSRGELDHPDTFEQRGNTFQDQVNEGYAHLRQTMHYPSVDAARSIEDIQVEIRQIFGV